MTKKIFAEKNQQFQSKQNTWSGKVTITQHQSESDRRGKEIVWSEPKKTIFRFMGL